MDRVTAIQSRQFVQMVAISVGMAALCFLMLTCKFSDAFGVG